MMIEDYLIDPCGASSLPYWKTQSVTIPRNVRIVRDDMFDISQCKGRDEPYFKLLHDLETVKEPVLPKGYELVQCEIEAFADQINACYLHVHLLPEDLLAYMKHPVYRPDLWLAVKDAKSDIIVATGIAELDAHIGEGILEWIQVLPAYRRKGLGSFVVCELLKRMRSQASFATVSGQMNNSSNPFALYESCGFSSPIIWHVITAE
jgi:GNAT superfamily N-acetyltransferase